MNKSASPIFLALILRLTGVFALAVTTAFAQQTWRWANSLPASVQWNGVAFGNGLHVAVGRDGTVATSPTGATWTITRYGNPATTVLNAVAFANGQFVAVGMGATRTGAALIMTSPDGTTWSVVETVANTVSAQLSDIAFGGGTWVAVGGAGANRILTSTDGRTWTARSAPGFANGSKLTYGAGRFVAAGSGNTALTSTDGITWTNPTVAPANTLLVGVAFGGGRFVLVGRDANFTAAAFTSTDGTIWTAAPAIANASNNTGFLNAVHDGTRFIAAGGVGIFTSPDGTAWTRQTSALGNSARQLGPQAENIAAISFANGQTFVLGIYGSITTSTDGATWTRRSTGTVNDLGAVLHDGARFVVAGSGGTILTSADGSSWTQVTTGQTADFNKLAYSGTRYVAAGFNGIYHSTNLTAWTAVAGSTFDRISGLVFGNNRFVSAQPTGTRTSTDGLTWSSVNTLTGINSLVFGSGVFVTTFGGFGTATRILSSVDGVVWTDRTPTGLAAPAIINSIAFGSGRFVALTSDRRSVTSTDGITWTLNSLPTAYTIQNIYTSAGQFIANDTGAGASPRSSSDGLTWTTVDSTSTPSFLFSGTATANGVVVSVGTSGTIIVSEPPASPNAPRIAAAPAAQTISTGGTAVFTTAATGEGLSYQWRLNGIPIAGATGSTLVVRGATAANAGSYVCVVTNSFGSTSSAAAVLSLSSNPDFGRISALSILTDITATDPKFTVGASISGVGSTLTKPLLVRAAGPSLTPLGVANALADPKLDVFSGQTVIASNDNWGGDPAIATAISSVGVFAFTNASSRDAAIFNPAIAAGGYTVEITGVGGATGRVIAEIYDGTPSASFTAATPRLIAVSVLKSIPAGSPLTAGFVIGGSTNKTVLVRAIGPRLGLAPFGIPTAMADPKLDLYRGQTVIASNDNWGGDPQLTAVGGSVGAFAVTDAASKDAMILVTLAPGNYTAEAGPLAGTTGGTAIVEVYEVP